MSLSKNINPSLVLVQPRKTRPFITERLLMGHKEANQTKAKNVMHFYSEALFFIFEKSADPDEIPHNFAKEPVCRYPE